MKITLHKNFKPSLIASILSLLFMYAISTSSHACDLNPRDYNLPQKVDFVQYYEGICGFNEGLALVTDGQKFGFINKQGNIIIPIIYDKSDIFFRDGIIRVELNEKFGVINSKNQTIVPIDYDFIDKFRFYNGLIAVTKAGKSGVFNHDGQLIIPVQYDKVDIQDKNIFVKKENKWGIFDRVGNEIIPISLDYEYIGNFSDGLAYVKTYDGKYGFINTQGQLVIDSSYDYAESFDDGNAIIGLFRNATNTADNYSLTLPSQDSTITSAEFWSNVEADINSKRYGVINTYNQPIISIKYDSVRELDHTGFFAVKQDDKHGLFDNTGKVIIPIEFDDVQKEHSFFPDMPHSYELIKVENNEKYGLYDTTGNLLVPVEYDAIIISNDYAEAKNGEESHYYDWNGNMLDGNNPTGNRRNNAINEDTP